MNHEVVQDDSFAIAAIYDELILAAIELVQKHNINASDAVILRGLLNLRQSFMPDAVQLFFWCCDKRLLRAARAEGIHVFDPETETLEQLNKILYDDTSLRIGVLDEGTPRFRFQPQDSELSASD